MEKYRFLVLYLQVQIWGFEKGDGMQMKSGFLVLVILLGVMFLLVGCDFLRPNSDVYVTVDTIGATLITVKFLEPTDNAGSYLNDFDNSVGIEQVDGYEWYLYQVPKGTYDVYIEWTGGIESNGRARVTLDADSASNAWAAVYVDPDGNVWGETGGGDFEPLMSNNY